MAFKLTVADVLEFQVKGSVRSADALVPFSFHMQADRIDAAEYRNVFADGSEIITRDFLQEHVKGWRGQRLVVDDATGQPADYSPDALDALLVGVVGMEATVLAAYVQALQIGDTAAGRAKN